MRKTSHDGADSTSITSDYDTKKSIASISKMKKNSIKRKVQNFSHESDDGIIEPLLETDKEKVEIANKSAKFLLNKSKTDTVNERDNKISGGLTDKCSTLSTPTSSTSHLISNNVNENPINTSYICGSAPIHNHMNTNVFGTYDAAKGFITTKNPVLVEIDSSKPGAYSPSPLIFTTAKIHTDSKTKLMEPVQVTPVPILSTIEVSLVKAEVVNNVNSKISSLPSEVMKNNSEKSDDSLIQTGKSKPIPISIHSLTKSEVISPKENYGSNELKKKNESVIKSSVENNEIQCKDQKLRHLSNNVLGQATLPEMSTSVSKEIRSSNQQPITDIKSGCEKSNLPLKPSKSQSATNNSLEKANNTGKIDEKTSIGANKNDSKIGQFSDDSQKHDNASKKNIQTPGTKILNAKVDDSALKTSITTSNKKLLRQKSAVTEEIGNGNIKTIKADVNNVKKGQATNLESKIDETRSVELDYKKSDADSSRGTIPKAPKVIGTSKESVIISSPENKSVTSSISTISKSIPSTIPSTSKIKSTPETSNTNISNNVVSKDISKSISKPLNVTPKSGKDIKESAPPSISPLPSHSLTSSKISATPLNEKSDGSSSLSQPVKSDLSVKYTDIAVSKSLPSYIVSTSKTKIGSTLTSSTSPITSKSQTQKPLVDVITTSQSAKSSTSSAISSKPTSANGTKYSNQTKTVGDTKKKDGRA